MSSARFWCCLIWIGFASVLHAHDPGLSSADVEIGRDQISVTVVFNVRDAQSAAPAGLDTIRERCFEIALDGRVIAPRTADPVVDANNNVEYQLRFPRTPASKLMARSLLLPQLPFGHRQYLKIRDAEGRILAQKLLSEKLDSVEIALAPASTEPSQTTPPSAQPTFFAFLRLGIEHILTGYDHLLFLGGLLLVCSGFRQAAMVITCFTVAHSITLALAALNIVSIPSRIVEPCIAASIAYVGIENIIRHGRVPRRGVLTFAFGLIHGLGFASVLREMGIGAGGSAIAVPLVAFNLGVEIGQLSVAAVLLPIIFALRKNPGFLRIGIPVSSLAIALAGAFWFVERTLWS